MKALDKIREAVAARREARLDRRIGQAAGRYPEPGNPGDWYQVTLNDDRELTDARKDAAFWCEEYLKSDPALPGRKEHWWDLKEAEAQMRMIETDRAIELDAALAYDAREDHALRDAIEAAERFPDKIGSQRDWLIVPGDDPDAKQLHRIAQAREELIAEPDEVERLSLRSALKDEEWELLEWREHRYSPYDEYEPETGPEPGTYEWQIETGNYIDPEPDWSKDPAVNPVDGTRYYNSGRVEDRDGNEIAPAYTEEQWEALRNPRRAEEMSAAEFDALFPQYPQRGDWDEAHPGKFIGPPEEDATPDWPETDLSYVTREDAERDAVEAGQRDRDAVKAHDAEQEDDRPKAEAEQAQRLP